MRRQDVAQRAGEAVRDHEALAGDRDRRREEPLPRQPAAVRPREVQAGHGAGDADRDVAVVVALVAVLAVDEEHRGRGGHRRALAEVVHGGLAHRRGGRAGTRRPRCSPPPGGRPRARTRWPPPRRRRCRRPSAPRRRPATRSRSARRPCRAGRGRACSRRGSRPARASGRARVTRASRFMEPPPRCVAAGYHLAPAGFQSPAVCAQIPRGGDHDAVPPARGRSAGGCAGRAAADAAPRLLPHRERDRGALRARLARRRGAVARQPAPPGRRHEPRPVPVRGARPRHERRRLLARLREHLRRVGDDGRGVARRRARSTSRCASRCPRARCR